MLFRGLTELIVAVLLLTVLRSVIGVLMKMFGNAFGTPPAGPSGASGGTPGQRQQRPAMPAGGELKKDPVCGTFIAAATSLQKRVGGEIYYFCSAACRDKFQA
jgi:YHS domain-containing protein